MPHPVVLRSTTTVDFEWRDNADLEFTIAWIELDDDGAVVGPLDVSEWTFAAHMRPAGVTAGAPLAAATITQPADHQTTVTFSAADLATARGEVDVADWDLRLVTDTGHAATPYGGKITLNLGVTA